MQNRHFMSQRKKTTRRGPALPGVIFVVDDEPLLGEFAGAVLEGEGHEVKLFTEPQRALQAIKESPLKPIALVTDYDMKGMNGLELILAAEKICPKLKTVLLSGSVDGSILSGHPAHVDRFLGKPYQPEQLKSLVGELLPR
jgi:CheY-like chemotaxis protein